MRKEGITMKSKGKNKIEIGKATFLIEVLAQENHSFQGRITWIEEKRSISFRSALELMKLMDSAIPVGSDYQDFSKGA